MYLRYAAKRGKLPKPKPEQSAKEKGNIFLVRVRFGGDVGWGRDLQTGGPGASYAGADLSGVSLREQSIACADLEGARLVETNLAGAKLWNVRLRGADLRGANLCSTTFEHCFFEGADLRDAKFWGTSLNHCYLEGANLHEADLNEMSLDRGTYYFSRWTPEYLAELHRRGAWIDGLNQFPEDAQEAVFRRLDGLLLTFCTRLAPVDKVVVEGLVAVLRGGSDCRVVEYREQAGGAVVRLEATHRDDLEAVAEALYHRVWELEERVSRTALALVEGGLGPVVTRLQKLQEALGTSLSDLVGCLERMELRLPDEDAKVMLDEQAATKRALRLVRTWTPSDNPRTALDRLLASFDPDEVRLLALEGPEGPDLVANLPAGPASPAQVGSEMVSELLRRGLLDEAFFSRLEVAHSDRAEEVRKVATLWRDVIDKGT